MRVGTNVHIWVNYSNHSCSLVENEKGLLLKLTLIEPISIFSALLHNVSSEFTLKQFSSDMSCSAFRW